MSKNYPEALSRLRGLSSRLARELPGPMAAYGQLHSRTLSDGALTRREKELIALGIAVGSRCEGCIAYHTHDALKAGATRAEILETVGVAVLMGGGPAAVHGCEVLDALDQFEAETAPRQA